MTIDNMFKQPSDVVARELIGKTLVSNDKKYLISAAKAYRGPSRSETSKERMGAGQIMIFTLRGYAHFCIATGEGQEQEYVFISGLRDGAKEIDRASGICAELNLSKASHGKMFADYFLLEGESQHAGLQPTNGESGTCVASYKLECILSAE